MGRGFIQEELVYVASHEICWNEIIYIYIYIYMYMLSLQAILNDYNNRSKLYYHDQKLFKFRKSVWLE